jgi:membrane-bound ClpP family serine protease
MNKVRILGLILLLVAVVIQFYLEHEAADFLTGLFAGAGIPLMIIGRFNSMKKK